VKIFSESHLLPLSILLAGVMLSASLFFVYNSLNKKLDLMNQKLEGITGIKLDSNSNALPEGPTENIQIDLSGKELRGNTQAKLTIIEFSDFECPFCAQVHPVLKQLLANYDGRVNLAYFNLPFHQHSFIMSEAFECAGLQGKKWGMHDLIFDRAGEFFDKAKDDYIPDADALTKLKEFAVESKLDSKSFDACMGEHKTKAIIDKDADLASSLSFRGTPTFVINGKKYSGAMSLKQFQKIIDENLKTA